MQTDFGLLGEIIHKKINSNNDFKAVITSTNFETGLGKTTLGTLLCWDVMGGPDSWDPYELGVMGVGEYIEKYTAANNVDIDTWADLDRLIREFVHGDKEIDWKIPAGSAMLLDEVGLEADRRRPMAKTNVDFRHAWSVLRFRNMFTVATLPSKSLFDSDLMKFTDIWINVVDRGVAHPYEVLVNDFSGDLRYSRLQDNGRNLTIHWDPIDDHWHKDYMDVLKQQYVLQNFAGYIDEEDSKSPSELRKIWNEQAVKAWGEKERFDRQKDIAEILDITQPRVSQILKGE